MTDPELLAKQEEEDRAAPTAFMWLIEAPGARYLGVRELGVYEFYWTQDHNAALRFRNEADADLTMMAVRELAPHLFAFAALLGDARAVEHGWLAGSEGEAKAPGGPE